MEETEEMKSTPMTSGDPPVSERALDKSTAEKTPDQEEPMEVDEGSWKP